MIMSARQLGTGVAKDVSGVLRITRGGSIWHRSQQDYEAEYLYFVAPDSGVKVFERGA